MKLCAYCKRSMTRTKYCSRRCACRARNTSAHQKIAGKAGGATKIALRGTGRPDVYIKYFGRHEHRVVMEQMIGRPLKKGEVVHHIDGDPHNNRPDNLQLITQSIHINLHRAEMERARAI